MSEPLIDYSNVAGIFRGFTERGLEFHADLTLPYQSNMNRRPLHGQFLLIELEGRNEAVLGRITSLRSEGLLISDRGEEYLYRYAREGEPPPEDLRQKFLKYRVNIRVLGVLRRAGEEVVFTPSQRRIPHVGSSVVFPSPAVLQEIAGHGKEGASLGHLAMGEFVWCGNSCETYEPKTIVPMSPEVQVPFSVQSLISRRTFVFARAGYGKSNLVKLLFSELYRRTPTVMRRGGKEVPVGTVIFDRDGEYFWPDHRGRPGLCDVEHLQDKLVVFTNRKAPSQFYEAFTAGGVRLDIRRLPASVVVGLALSAERQDQQNVRKLKALNKDKWRQAVDMVYEHGYQASLDALKSLLGIEASQGDAEVVAALSNLNTIVRMLHDPSNRLLDLLREALKRGKLVVIDLSMLGGEAALVFSALTLQHIFDYNQEHFTRQEADTIPTIAVLEEAQSVLGHGSSQGESAYVAWVKEGRKYDLGAVLITQQPGSINDELLSQGDNWFVFHLLSAADLKAVQRANAHFSDDLLSSILNEPIPGQCVFWSGVGGRAYPLPVRVRSFEAEYVMRDKEGDLPPPATAVGELRQALEGRAEGATEPPDTSPPTESGDYLAQSEEQAIRDFLSDPELHQTFRLYNKGDRGVLWGKLVGLMKKHLDSSLEDQINVFIKRALDEAFGEGNWEQKKVSRRDGQPTTAIQANEESLRRFLEGT